MSTQEKGEGIRTRVFRYMRRGSQPIDLLIRNEVAFKITIKLVID
jgi:hypothetical protein